MRDLHTILRALLSALLVALATVSSAQDSGPSAFEIDALNPGLGPAPSDLDLSTPQASMEAFLEAAWDEDWDRAAHVLNLSQLPEDVQSTRGPELARKLDSLIDRKVIIDWGYLLEREDSLDGEASGDGAMAGQPRKSLMLAILELDYRNVALRLDRVQPEGGDPVWVFSSQSVDNIDGLYRLYGPSRFERMLPDVVRQDAFLGLKWWEVIGVPLFGALAILLAVATWHLLGRIAEGRRPFVERIIRGLRLPATLVVLGLVLWITTSQVFIFSGLISGFIEPLIAITFVAAGMMVGVSILDAILERITRFDLEGLSSPEKDRQRSIATTISALRRLGIVAAVVLAAGIVLTSVEIFQTLGFSLLAGAGALTIILGFAGREALANLLSSLQISLNRSARVGDQLIYEGHLCHVEAIRFTYVQLKVWDNTRLVVPVSEFVSNAFINRNLVDGMMIRHAILITSPRLDVSRLREDFFAWAKGDDRVGEEEDITLHVVDQDEHGLHLRFSAPVPDPRDGWQVECDMREAMAAQIADYEKESGEDLLPHLGTGSAVDRDGDDAE